MKFGCNWPSSFRGGGLKLWTDDGACLYYKLLKPAFEVTEYMNEHTSRAQEKFHCCNNMSSWESMYILSSHTFKTAHTMTSLSSNCDVKSALHAQSSQTTGIKSLIGFIIQSSKKAVTSCLPFLQISYCT